MSNKSLMISFLFLLLSQDCCWCSASRSRDSFIDKPDEEVYSDEGSSITLEWHFHVGSWSSSSTTVSEFLFGVWDDPGYVRNKILAVQERNVVHKRSGFERKVNWSGNIYDCVNCTATVIMYNLTDVDFKKYGVEVEVSLDRSHLTNWLRLVKLVPAEIIKWSQRIKVEEGHATAIECKAKGRPSPSVIIEKKNRTLCNDSTGHCVYEIRKTKPEDEGEYLCLVQQRNYSQIRRSMYLTVLEERNISAIDTNAENRTTIKTTQNDTRMAVLGQTADSDIKGFITEPLDLVCIKPRRDENMNVARYLSQNLEKPDKLKRFLISKWNETVRNYTKICNTEHKLYNICSQVTSYVTANVTHFVIESAPLDLNGYKTQCAYEYQVHTLKPDSRGSVQIIELRDKIEGYVGERIEKVCYHPSSYRCRSVTLNINNTETKTSDTNMNFPCLHSRYYDVCRDHMNLSYKRNGTTSTTASSTTTSINGTTTLTDKGLTGGAIAGIVIAVLLAFIAIAVGIVCWWKRMCCCQQNGIAIPTNDNDNDMLIQIISD